MLSWVVLMAAPCPRWCRPWRHRPRQRRGALAARPAGRSWRVARSPPAALASAQSPTAPVAAPGRLDSGRAVRWGGSLGNSGRNRIDIFGAPMAEHRAESR